MWMEENVLNKASCNFFESPQPFLIPSSLRSHLPSSSPLPGCLIVQTDSTTLLPGSKLLQLSSICAVCAPVPPTTTHNIPSVALGLENPDINNTVSHWGERGLIFKYQKPVLESHWLPSGYIFMLLTVLASTDYPKPILLRMWNPDKMLVSLCERVLA